MKVEVQYSGKKREHDYDDRCEIVVDGVSLVYAMNLGECPEDANLVRDLNFVYRIPDFLRKAHADGWNGEPFELVEIEDSDL